MSRWCLLLFSLIGLSLAGDKDGAFFYLSEAQEKLNDSLGNLSNVQFYLTRATELFHTCREKAKCKEKTGKILDCADLQETDSDEGNGVYTIWPANRLTMNKGVNVYCDMETDGGGWTVIQRRGRYGKYADYFYRDSENFKKGFGNLNEDFWLGNDNIFALTNQKAYSVRYDMTDKYRRRAYGHYDKFWIDDELNQYALHIAGYKGNAGDAMSSHDKSKFSTKDRKNDGSSSTACALKFQSGWWFYDHQAYCFSANLNGMYYNSTYGIIWTPFRGTSDLLWTEIKIRPDNYIPVRLWETIPKFATSG